VGRGLILFLDVSVAIADGMFPNIAEEGFDAGVRIGKSGEMDMIAVRIGLYIPEIVYAEVHAAHLRHRRRPRPL